MHVGEEVLIPEIAKEQLVFKCTPDPDADLWS